MTSNITIEERVSKLEKTRFCGKPKFTTFENFPQPGVEDTLYVDEEESEIYIWNGTGYTLLNEEKRVCLNTAIPTFSPTDHKNPTISEVETYVTTNNINTNGTQLVYFVDDKYLPQNELTIFIDRDEETVLTSFIVNGDELITSPIMIADIGGNFVYSGQLQPLFNAWLLANPNIQATLDDSLLEDDWSIYIVNIIGGDLTIDHAYYYLGGTMSESNTSPVNISEGDGGSCDNPDYTWTVNGSEVTLSNKRIFTSKTVYVDADSGSDVTGRRGYREFPFKSLDGAFAEIQDGDTLHVLPGTYTSGITITDKLFNIYCEPGVTWNQNTNLFNIVAGYNSTKTRNLSLTFDVLQASSVLLWNVRNEATDSIVTFKANRLTRSNINFWYNTLIAEIGIAEACKVINFGTTSFSNFSSNINVEKYVTLRFTPNEAFNIGPNGLPEVLSHLYIKNIKITSSGNSHGLVGYNFASDTGINKTYYSKLGNVYANFTNMYTTAPSWDANLGSWTVFNTSSMIYVRGSITEGSILNTSIENFKGIGNGVFIDQLTMTDNLRTINVDVKGHFNKGIPVPLRVFPKSGHIININLDVTCDTSPGILIDLSNGGNLTTTKYIISGKIRTNAPNMPCIVLRADNTAFTTNSNVILKDLILINGGAVSPIKSNMVSNQNIIIQNVVSNSLVSDANILEIGQSIIRNANYQ